MGCRTKILWKSFQLRSIVLRNRFIASLCTSNWFFGPKRENTGLVHFPLGFRGKNFKNFRKNFSAQNCIKRYIRYWVFAHENGGPVYEPIRHTGGLEKFLPKFRNNPQMEKIGDCAWWVHILGVGCGPNKVPYHTFVLYKYWLLLLSPKKVMYLQNTAPKCPFFWRVSFKALYFTPLNPQRPSGG